MSTDPLLVSFASAQPEELANLLVSADLDELTSILLQLPEAVAAQLASNLPSWQLSSVLQALEPALVGKMLTAAQHEDAIALVSHLNENQYPQILAASSRARRKALSLLFDFPSHSLAALASPEFIRVAGNTRCQQFHKQLQRHEERVALPIYTVDEQGGYLGEVSLIAVIADCNRHLPVRDIANPVVALSGRMSASAAIKLPQWLHHDSLPVVDARKRLLGTLSRHSLHKIVPADVARGYHLDQMVADTAQRFLEFCEQFVRFIISAPRQ
jgi:Mg/Co/Ni transporter MgtE